jgi:rhodanese-related sulfurtransferase
MRRIIHFHSEEFIVSHLLNMVWASPITAAAIALAACRPAESKPGAAWTEVTAVNLATEITSGSHRLTLVDVREPELFAKGHIPGAMNMPYPAAKHRAPVELAADQDIVFVCHGGPMGAELAGILAAKGFSHVRNLAGGMTAWAGPTETAQ